MAFDYTPCFSTSFSIIFIFTSFSFFFNFPSFCSLYFFFFYSFFFYFLLQRLLILLGLSGCHKFQLHFMSPSCLKWRERSSRFNILKWSHAHLKRRWQAFVGATSHNTSFKHYLVLNFILAWFGWKLVGNLSFSTNLWLTTLLSLS